MFETRARGRHLLDGRRRHAVRPAADAGHRVHHLVDARRRGRGDLRVAQPVSGQRHQDLRRRRLQAARRGRGRARGADGVGRARRAMRPHGAEIGKATSIDDVARPLRRVPEERVPARADARRPQGSSSTAPTAPPTRSRRRSSRSSAPTSSRIGVEPDGTQHQRRLRRAAPGEDAARRSRSTAPHLGIALDGDADRVILFDENGRDRRRRRDHGDLRARMLERGELKHKTLVATVMSNLGLERALETLGRQAAAHGRSAIATSSRRCATTATTSAASSRGTSSSSTTRRPATACSAALQVLAVMLESGKPLSELRARDDALSAGAGQLQGRREAAARRAAGRRRRSSPRSRRRSAPTGACWCATRGPRPKARVMIEGPGRGRSSRRYADEIARALESACGAAELARSR